MCNSSDTVNCHGSYQRLILYSNVKGKLNPREQSFSVIQTYLACPYLDIKIRTGIPFFFWCFPSWTKLHLNCKCSAANCPMEETWAAFPRYSAQGYHVLFLLSSAWYSPKYLNVLEAEFLLLCILSKFGLPCRAGQCECKVLPGENGQRLWRCKQLLSTEQRRSGWGCRCPFWCYKRCCMGFVVTTHNTCKEHLMSLCLCSLCFAKSRSRSYSLIFLLVSIAWIFAFCWISGTTNQWWQSETSLRSKCYVMDLTR